MRKFFESELVWEQITRDHANERAYMEIKAIEIGIFALKGGCAA